MFRLRTRKPTVPSEGPVVRRRTGQRQVVRQDPTVRIESDRGTPSLIFNQYLSQPWSQNYEISTPVNPTFCGMSIEMYTFYLSPTAQFSNYIFNTTQGVCITCKVFDSGDLINPRNISNNYNTINGLNQTLPTQLMQLGKYLSINQYNIEIPCSYWGEHDSSSILTLELSLYQNQNGKLRAVTLTSSKFHGVASISGHLA